MSIEELKKRKDVVFQTALKDKEPEELERYFIESAEALSEAVESILDGYLFSFDRIAGLDDRAVQKILREIDSSVLAQALKDAPRDVGMKFFDNMSTQAGSNLKEEMEFMGTVPPKRSREGSGRL